MIHFDDDVEDDYDVLDHGIFSEAEEDNDVEKPSKKSGGEEDGEENGRLNTLPIIFRLFNSVLLKMGRRRRKQRNLGHQGELLITHDQS